MLFLGMVKTKGMITKKVVKAKSGSKYVLQKKSNIVEYFVYDDKKELDASLSMLKSFGVTTDDYNSYKFDNEEKLLSFKDSITNYTTYTPEQIDLSDDSEEKCSVDANNAVLSPEPLAERVTRSTMKISCAATASTLATAVVTMPPLNLLSSVPIKAKCELFCNDFNKTGGTKLNFSPPLANVNLQARVPVASAVNGSL